jgi:hypothetical protein
VKPKIAGERHRAAGGVQDRDIEAIFVVAVAGNNKHTVEGCKVRVAGLQVICVCIDYRPFSSFYIAQRQFHTLGRCFAVLCAPV